MEERSAKKRPRWGLRIALILLAALVLAAGGFALFAKLAPESAGRAAADFADDGMDFLFNKTIHDFPGHVVDNLDDREDTNFVVYAEGVQRVTAEPGRNDLIDQNDEARVYTFENPDEQLTGLEAGDVFFLDASTTCPAGLAVKVETVTVTGGQVVVTGGDLAMEDLIEYADVDMDLPLTELYYQDTAGLTTAALTEYTADEPAAWAAQDNSAFLAEAAQLAAEAPQFDPAAVQSDHTLNASMQEAVDAAAGDDGVLDWLLTEHEQSASLPVCIDLRTNLSAHAGKGFVEGEVGAKVRTVHVVFRYHPILLNVKMGVAMDARTYAELKLGMQVSGRIECPFAPQYPIPVAGPLCVILQFSPYLEASLSAYGKLAAAADLYVEGGVSSFAGIMLPYGTSSGFQNPVTDLDFVEVEGKVDANLFNGVVSFGVPGVAHVGLSAHAGPGLTARLEFPEKDEVDDDGSIHDCDACVDGDLDLFAGLDLQWVLGPGGKGTFFGTGAGQNGLNWRLLEGRMDMPFGLSDFYVSTREDSAGERKIECDMGECPYKGYPVDVQILSDLKDAGVPLDGFVVRAVDEEGKVEWEYTDEEGKARLLLSSGKHEVSVDHGMYHSKKEQVVLKEKGADLEFEVEIEPQVFVVEHLWEDQDAGGTPIREVMGNTQYTLLRMVQQFDLDEYTLENELLLAGAKPGDIVVWFDCDKAATNVASGDGWNNYGFLLGFCNIRVGRLLFVCDGVDEETGEEYGDNVGLYWWAESYNNYTSNGSGLYMGNFHDNLNSGDDYVPEFENVELSNALNLTTAEGRYDAAYVVRDVESALQYLHETDYMGTQGFWSLYNGLSHHYERMVGTASAYSVYVREMLANRDFASTYPEW